MQTPPEGNIQHCFDALLVHLLQPRIAVVPVGMFGQRFVIGMAHRVDCLAPGKVIVEQAGLRDARADSPGPGNSAMRLVADEIAQLTVQFDQPDAAFGKFGTAIAGEGVADFPIVIVGIEDRTEFAVVCGLHGFAPSVQAVPWRSSLPGVAWVHSPLMNVGTPLTMI